jgi:PAS domain S-box-containing protein
VALLAAALRAQGDGIVILERGKGRGGLRIVFANESMGNLVERSVAELVGQLHRSLHSDASDVQRLWQRLARGRPGQSIAGEGFLVRTDGRVLSAAWSFSALRDAAGQPTHLVGTYRDQTERRRLQDSLVHAQRLDAVERLAGGVAHDFNNLLSVINGYCEMLAAHVAANPQAMREVAEIHAAGRKAAALTQQLLAFSRRQPFNARVINLNTLIRENIEILRRLVGATGQLEFELADNLPNTRTDPAQFQQVLLNLVLNARDALRDRGRIVVSTTARELPPDQHRRVTDTPPGRCVVLAVADNGTGMDAETQLHLFEPFFTTKPEGKGTGLGLALVHGVVQQSGGEISVRSALLVGSTFEIVLPATTVAAEPPPPTVEPLPSVRGSEPIALIEPDDLVRKMVAGMLTADGYQVTAARTFAELPSEPAATRPVQLIITALTPEAERWGRRLLQQNPQLRVLGIRQSERCKAAVSWLPPGRQAYLMKPYALSELIRLTRKMLDS